MNHRVANLMNVKKDEETYFIELDEHKVQKLPYLGPISRRIYLTVMGNRERIEELFVQRKDVFTSNLIEALRRLKTYEIKEIKYFCGISGLIRIYLTSDKVIRGEFFCKNKQELDNFLKTIITNEQLNL